MSDAAQIRVTPAPSTERWLEERGITLGCVVELGHPLVEILEPGRPPRRFIAVQGGLIVPEDPPTILTLE